MNLSQYGIDLNNAVQPGSNGTPTVTVPGLSNLSGLLGIISVASLVIGIVFVILYVVTIVQRMRSEHAMVVMQKDIAQIKILLEQQLTSHQPATTPEPIEPAADVPKA